MALNKDNYISAANRILNNPENKYWAFLAVRNNDVIGVITIGDKISIYAEGHFGEILEFYILPEYRSLGFGHKMIEHITVFGKNRGWPFIEVGAPKQPESSKTVEFYKQNNFKEIGPRLELKLYRI